jgi:hypothetical protein
LKGNIFLKFTYDQLMAAAKYHESLAQRFRDLAQAVRENPADEVFFDMRSEKTIVRERRQSSSKQKRAIYNDLKQHTDSSVREIHQRTHIPQATIYLALKDKTLFRKKGKFFSLARIPRSLTEPEL